MKKHDLCHLINASMYKFRCNIAKPKIFFGKFQHIICTKTLHFSTKTQTVGTHSNNVLHNEQTENNMHDVDLQNQQYTSFC